MCIPRAHRLAMAYVEKLRLATLPFVMYDPRGGTAMSAASVFGFSEAGSSAEKLGFGFSASERGKTAAGCGQRLWSRS